VPKDNTLVNSAYNQI